MLGVLFLRQDLPAAGHRSPTTPDWVPLGGAVIPCADSSIMWTIKFRNGKLKRFKFPIRTTPEGSIDRYGGKPAPSMDNNHVTETGMTFNHLKRLRRPSLEGPWQGISGCNPGDLKKSPRASNCKGNTQ